MLVNAEVRRQPRERGLDTCMQGHRGAEAALFAPKVRVQGILTTLPALETLVGFLTTNANIYIHITARTYPDTVMVSFTIFLLWILLLEDNQYFFD
jgi:hypothetical protein